MDDTRIVSFDSKTIEDFCRISGDVNLLHDSSRMHQKGYLSIVPALLVASYSLLHVPKKDSALLEGPFRLDLSIGSILHEGEEVRLERVDAHKEEGIERVFAYTHQGNDFLSSGERQTLIAPFQPVNNGEYTRSLNDRAIKVGKESYSDFLSFFNTKDSSLSQWLYVLCCQSKPLFDALDNPINNSEKEIADKINSGSVPAYLRIQAAKDKEFSFGGSDPIDYRFLAEPSGKRGFRVNMSACDDSPSPFVSASELVLLPKRAFYSTVRKFSNEVASREENLAASNPINL